MTLMLAEYFNSNPITLFCEILFVLHSYEFLSVVKALKFKLNLIKINEFQGYSILLYEPKVFLFFNLSSFMSKLCRYDLTV